MAPKSQPLTPEEIAFAKDLKAQGLLDRFNWAADESDDYAKTFAFAQPPAKQAPAAVATPPATFDAQDEPSTERVAELLKLYPEFSHKSDDVRLDAALRARADTILAATPLGREVLASRKDATFAADSTAAGDVRSSVVESILKATPEGRAVLKERAARAQGAK